LRPLELKAIKELRSLSDILFIKADKGNMTVFMKKQDYDEKLFKMLSNDETYENLKSTHSFMVIASSIRQQFTTHCVCESMFSHN